MIAFNKDYRPQGIPIGGQVVFPAHCPICGHGPMNPAGEPGMMATPLDPGTSPDIVPGIVDNLSHHYSNMIALNWGCPRCNNGNGVVPAGSLVLMGCELRDPDTGQEFVPEKENPAHPAHLVAGYVGVRWVVPGPDERQAMRKVEAGLTAAVTNMPADLFSHGVREHVSKMADRRVYILPAELLDTLCGGKFDSVPGPLCMSISELAAKLEHGASA